MKNIHNGKNSNAVWMVAYLQKRNIYYPDQQMHNI
jgi:hypothetical protein